MTVTQLPRRTEHDEHPRTSNPRWVPTRAGILNLWRYYDEVLEFHNGRLLLRGPNGTGKSKALELLLPFLFDASLRPNRLSTFGTGERTMWWNLMGEGATGSTRVGYAWLEFALDGQGGQAQRWFCCGARLQASEHTKSAQADFFTTSMRIGTPDGLSLVTDSGAPLSRKALDETLGEYGTLHATASEYRTEVRHTLFPELNEQRYDALITALLQLRQPKLSERLDPGLLSTLLSRALPPLGQAEITELAEGFERLDRQREHLRELDEEAEAAKTVADRQARYAQRVLRSVAGELISATSELDTLTRTARESEERYTQVVQRRDEVSRHKESLDQRAASLNAEIAGLTDSEEYKQGKELDKLRTRKAEADRAANRERDLAQRKQETAGHDRSEAESADWAAHTAASNASAARDDAKHAATRADLATVGEEIGSALDVDPQQAKPLLRTAVASKRSQIDEVGEALSAYDTALEKRGEAEGELEQARTRLSEASDQLDEYNRAYNTAVAEQGERLRQWAQANVELRVEDCEELAAAAESEPAVWRIVEPISRAVTRSIAAEETTTSQRKDDLGRQHAELATELERLRHEVDLPPVAPATRTADRATMAGAPFWKLLAFHDEVSAEVQAAVEAALQASGLLDAWVPADGSVEIVEHDTFLDIESLPRADGGSLADVLRVEPGGAVPDERVGRLLAGIAYGATLPTGHAAAIGADGRWRLAGATGSWAKPEAAHIGAVARERARQRRMTELAAQIDELDTEVAALEERLGKLDERRRQLDAELADRPGHETVDEARRTVHRAESHLESTDQAVHRWVDTLSTRERAVATALNTLTAVAAERGLPAEGEKLTALERAVDAFREVAETWLDRNAQLLAARERAETLAERARRSEEAAEEQRAALESAESTVRELAGTLEAVESTVGVDYRQVLEKLRTLREQQHDTEQSARAEERSLGDLREQLGSLATQRTVDAEKRDGATEKRDQAASSFRYLATGTFPADAGIELTVSTTDGVRATLDAARNVASTWQNIPHSSKNVNDAYVRLTEAVHSCRDRLSRRADLELEPDDDVDVQVLTASMDGVRVGAAELLATVRAEAERSRGDITSAERELFDKTLTGDTRRHLADRIRQAGELVEQMNARLERVRTASDVTVRLVWQVHPDLPAGTKSARELLLKDPVRLSDDDRESLHQFFRERIEQARADNAAASWEQQLTQVFDYTAWHQFVVKIDRGNGQGWQQLTKKMHGALSGGEKAIALHLPLFAAVAAHYQSVPTAPRLILLDEVFVGVDATNRGQVFELLSSLDLDLMLTSDHEWGMYVELDGIAIHQLMTDGEDDAVTTVHFTWDGADLTGEGEQ